MRFYLVTILFLFVTAAFSQELYIPRNVKQAYENNTRSKDGMPGKNYWQNNADYKIKAEVEPSTRLLKGNAEITYFNNSPDSLKEIVIRLNQDINKTGAARDFYIKREAVGEGIILNQFKINGSSINIDDDMLSRSGTNLFVKLDTPVPPKNGKVDLTIDWQFIIPDGSKIRMGTYDSTSFFIAYWFPQVSVYDDIDGWDKLNYTGQGEFYNDFADFDVEITVPEKFAVWSTGLLQNPEEILKDEYLNRWQSAHTSNSVVRIITLDDLEKNIFNAANGKIKWHYKAEYVPDFTFAMSDHYLWDAVSYQPEGKDYRTFISATYKKESQDFYEVAEISRLSIKYFSEEMPGYPFPYPSLTVWNGSGGMEFPMMINDGSASTYRGTVGVTSHEIAHQYLPFMMGINERKYAWMDEGWAVMLPFDFQERMDEGNNPRAAQAGSYEKLAGMSEEVPLIVPTNLLTGPAYRIHSYRRPAFAYDFLRDMLGDEKFKTALHGYFDRWKGKHPMPYDFFFTFNDILKENLYWYWQPWFFEFGYPDLSIKETEIEEGFVKVLVEKAGNIPVPIKLTFVSTNGEEVIFYQDASVWKDKNEIWIEQKLNFPLALIELGADNIPDADRENNMIQLNR